MSRRNRKSLIQRCLHSVENKGISVWLVAHRARLTEAETCQLANLVSRSFQQPDNAGDRAATRPTE